MKLSKRLGAIIAVAALAGLVACGPNNAATSPTPTPTAAATTAPGTTVPGTTAPESPSATPAGTAASEHVVDAEALGLSLTMPASIGYSLSDTALTISTTSWTIRITCDPDGLEAQIAEDEDKQALEESIADLLKTDSAVTFTQWEAERGQAELGGHSFHERTFSGAYLGRPAAQAKLYYGNAPKYFEILTVIADDAGQGAADQVQAILDSIEFK